MAIPQLNSEGVDQTGGSTAFTIDFSGFTFAINDILEISIVTDGWVPSITTANGWALAQDPQGNTASATTNGGTAGAGQVGMFVYWHRATGTTPTTDPPPVFAAPSAQSGTCWALEPNSYTGARTSGTPWHQIVTSILTTAATAITSDAQTSTLANCLFMTRVGGGGIDDSSFPNWAMSGSSGPSGVQVASGWHAAAGNKASFTGTDGGYATAGGPHNGTCSFATAAKQARISLIMASLAEVSAPDDEIAPPRFRPAPRLVAITPSEASEELPVGAASTPDEESSGAAQVRPAPRVAAASSDVADELPTGSASVIQADDDSPATPMIWPSAVWPGSSPSEDVAGLSAASQIEDDAGPPRSWLAVIQSPVPAYADDEPLTAAAASFVDEDAPAPPVRRVIAPWLMAPRLADDDISVAASGQITSGIGGACDAQRSFSAAPQSGTLTTVAPVPAWAILTAYVVDPTAGGINRVINGGNLYQCSVAGTSASVGGPTGTGTNITDGTVHWYFVGVAQGTNTTAGSQIVATVMRGDQSLTPGGNIDPTDNDGGTFVVISNTSYGGSFPNSFAGVWRRTAAANTKTGYTASAQWGGTSGAGDELSLAWIEVIGVSVGAPHAFSQVIRTSSTGGTVTAASISTTKRCLILSYWFGEGTVQSAGAPDTATPTGGLTLIAGSTAPLSLTANGYIQHACAWRIAAAGTFAEVWSASPTDQGAQLVTIAFEDLSTIPVTESEEPLLVWPVPRVWAPQPMMLQDELSVLSTLGVVEYEGALPSLPWSPAASPVQAQRWDIDEIAVLSGVDEDAAQPSMVAPAAPAPMPIARPDVDELPGLVADEDAMAGAFVTAPPSSAPTIARSDDELLILGIDEDAPPVASASAAASMIAYRADVDELTVAASPLVADEQPAVPSTPPPPPPVIVAARPDIDEVPTVAAGQTVVDDDDALRPAQPPVVIPVIVRLDADDVLPALAVVDDDGAPAVAAAQPAWVPAAQSWQDDELAQLAAEESLWTFVVTWPVAPAPRFVQVDDELAAVPAVDDEPPLPPPAIAPRGLRSTVWPDDEAPTPSALPPMVDEDGIMLVPRQLPAWIVSLASDDEFVVAGIVPPPPTWDTVLHVRARPSGFRIRTRRP